MSDPTSEAVRFWINGTTPVPLAAGGRPPDGFDALTAAEVAALMARLARWTPEALAELHAAMTPDPPAGPAGGGAVRPPPRPASLEYWPALADDWGRPGYGDDDLRTAGQFTVRTDDVGPGPGRWVATVVVNPALEPASRGRVARLLATAPALWQALAEYARHGDADAPGAEFQGRALRLLAEAADFVPVPSLEWPDLADGARRLVNEATTAGVPADPGVPGWYPPPGVDPEPAAGGDGPVTATAAATPNPWETAVRLASATCGGVLAGGCLGDMVHAGADVAVAGAVLGGLLGVMLARPSRRRANGKDGAP